MGLSLFSALSTGRCIVSTVSKCTFVKAGALAVFQKGARCLTVCFSANVIKYVP